MTATAGGTHRKTDSKNRFAMSWSRRRSRFLVNLVGSDRRISRRWACRGTTLEFGQHLVDHDADLADRMIRWDQLLGAQRQQHRHLRTRRATRHTRGLPHSATDREHLKNRQRNRGPRHPRHLLTPPQLRSAPLPPAPRRSRVEIAIAWPELLSISRLAFRRLTPDMVVSKSGCLWGSSTGRS